MTRPGIEPTTFRTQTGCSRSWATAPEGSKVIGLLIWTVFTIIEPAHGKTNKMTGLSSKNQINMGIHPVKSVLIRLGRCLGWPECAGCTCHFEDIFMWKGPAQARVWQYDLIPSDRFQRRFQQSFSYIATVSGCDRQLNAHFKSAASLTYHTSDTWRDIPPSHNILTLDRPVPLSQCRAQTEEQLIPCLKPLVWLGRGSNRHHPGHKPDALVTETLRQ